MNNSFVSARPVVLVPFALGLVLLVAAVVLPVGATRQGVETVALLAFLLAFVAFLGRVYVGLVRG